MTSRTVRAQGRTPHDTPPRTTRPTRPPRSHDMTCTRSNAPCASAPQHCRHPQHPRDAVPEPRSPSSTPSPPAAGQLTGAARATERRFNSRDWMSGPVERLRWRFTPSCRQSASSCIPSILSEGGIAISVARHRQEPGRQCRGYHATLQGFDVRTSSRTSSRRRARQHRRAARALRSSRALPLVRDLFRRAASRGQRQLRIRSSTTATARRRNRHFQPCLQDLGKYLGDATMATTILIAHAPRGMLEFEARALLKGAASSIALNPAPIIIRYPASGSLSGHRWGMNGHQGLSSGADAAFWDGHNET